MLVLRHRFVPRTMAARFAQEELRSEDLVVCRSRFLGGRFDEVPTLPSRARASRRRAWSKVRFILRGHVLARGLASDVVLAPGDLVVSAGWDDWACQALERDSEYLLVGWRHGSVAGERPRTSDVVRAPAVVAPPSPAAHAYALAAALDGTDDAAALRAAAALLGALAELGVPLSPEGARAAGEGISAADHRFARAMEATFFPLAAQPMAIDLGRVLGVGDRHAVRLANAFLQRYYVTAVGWREYVRGMRLELGVFLSGSEGATTNDVSRALGFRSPTTLCHAFAAVGLGSPLAVQRRLLRGDPRVSAL